MSHQNHGMFSSSSYIRLAYVLCVLLFSNNLFSAAPMNYSGLLRDETGLANGPHDLVFSLHLFDSGDFVTLSNRFSGNSLPECSFLSTNQLQITNGYLFVSFSNGLARVTNNNVLVSNGEFSTVLDFQEGIFRSDFLDFDCGVDNLMGTVRWLELAVRPSDGTNSIGVNTNDFTVLQPRQRVGATPYALVAEAIGNDVVELNLFRKGVLAAEAPGVGSFPLCYSGKIDGHQQMYFHIPRNFDPNRTHEIEVIFTTGSGDITPGTARIEVGAANHALNDVVMLKDDLYEDPNLPLIAVSEDIQIKSPGIGSEAFIRNRFNRTGGHVYQTRIAFPKSAVGIRLEPGELCEMYIRQTVPSVGPQIEDCLYLQSITFRYRKSF